MSKESWLLEALQECADALRKLNAAVRKCERGQGCGHPANHTGPELHAAEVVLARLEAAKEAQK